MAVRVINTTKDKFNMHKKNENCSFYFNIKFANTKYELNDISYFENEVN